MNKRLEQLLKKKEEINAQIEQVRAREAAQKRKEDTRRKILWGELVMEMMDKLNKKGRKQFLEETVVVYHELGVFETGVWHFFLE